MINYLFKVWYRLRFRIVYIYHNRFKTYNLEKYLLESKKLNWLDIGSSSNKSNLNFNFCDLYFVEECIPEFRDKYFQIDITKDINDNQNFNKYDFIRMQHVFEHFTFEEADLVLKNCSKLLKKGGILLITVPDLDIMINLYKKNLFKENIKFYNWATKRIKKEASPSDFFSIFTHSHLHQEHKWCYNKNGLFEKIKLSGLFEPPKKINLFDSYCSIPFTHNRPEEDLCVLAIKK
tara:strand:+ start:416 stop:1117 length:702 start_codon:yes stop_codon:yes gene_type:complete